jgi:hypothetical protein
MPGLLVGYTASMTIHEHSLPEPEEIPEDDREPSHPDDLELPEDAPRHPDDFELPEDSPRAERPPGMQAARGGSVGLSSNARG